MMDLITEHIDVWTSAQVHKKTGGRGRGKKSNELSIYGMKKLRELILELAVRGKLVPQDPDDEPASVLLETIAAEKTRLTKEGKIKKQKKLPGIQQGEKRFELPVTWEWVRLAGTGLGSTGKTPRTGNPFFFGGAIPFLGPGQITPEGDIIKSDKRLTEEGCRHSTLAESGDILMVCIGGSIGKSAIARSMFAFNQQINCIRPLFVDPTYLNSAMNTPHFQASILDAATGSATPIINRAKWESLLIALPPLAEQHRIVAKVEELMALCDKLEQQQTDSNATHQTLVETLLTTLTNATDQATFADTWQRIADHFDTLFTTEQSIDHLKQTILQLAVMGKLVPQDPDDEPAGTLLEKIAEEKAQLTKKGKIKKQKKQPRIDVDRQQFPMPLGWQWCNLADMFALVTDGDHQAPPKSETGIPFLVIGNLNTGKILFEGCKFVIEDYFQKLDWGRKPSNGDILFTVTGSYGIPIPVLSSEPFCVQRHVAILKSTFSTPQSYLSLLLRSTYTFDYVTKIATGIAQKTVPLTGLRKMAILVPPLAEQNRIVAKVGELMTLCDTLKAHLTDAQTTQVQLADTIVEQATN